MHRQKFVIVMALLLSFMLWAPSLLVQAAGVGVESQGHITIIKDNKVLSRFRIIKLKSQAKAAEMSEDEVDQIARALLETFPSKGCEHAWELRHIQQIDATLFDVKKPSQLKAWSVSYHCANCGVTETLFINR